MSDKEKEMTEEQLKKASGGRGSRELSGDELEDIRGAGDTSRGSVRDTGGRGEEEREAD